MVRRFVQTSTWGTVKNRMGVFHPSLSEALDLPSSIEVIVI